MRRFWLIIFSLVFLCACDFKLKNEENETVESVEIQRYDRLESLYLTTGDFSALQQMSTDYPVETRTLIEDVLNLGKVDDPDINNKFLAFYQDSTLQSIIVEAESQYASMDDLNKSFNDAFKKLQGWVPELKAPLIYAQICALDQSIIIGDASVGISLDKYLGEDYPPYKKYYTEEQRKTMNRENILPDCLSFYLLSRYHLPNFGTRPQFDRDMHVGKIQWVVNKAIDKPFFQSEYVTAISQYMAKHPNLSIKDLLNITDYQQFK